MHEYCEWRCETLRCVRVCVCVCVCVWWTMACRCSKWTYIDCQSNRQPTAPVIAFSCSTVTRARLCQSRCAATSRRQRPSPAVRRCSSSSSSPTEVEPTPASCSDTRSSRVNWSKSTSTTARLLALDSDCVRNARYTLPVFTGAGPHYP